MTSVLVPELVKETEGLEESKALTLRGEFTDMFTQAQDWAEKASKIQVTSVTQVAEMKQAKEARLALKNLRCETEKTRKRLKENCLREGKAIDGMANLVKYLVVPIEEHLKEQEDFILRKLAEEAALKLEARQDKIRNADPSIDVSILNLGGMEDEQFETYLAQVIETKALREKEAARLDLEKKAAEEAAAKKREEDRIERERLEKENAKLEAEKKAREAEAEKARIAAENKLAAERKAQEEKLRIEREAKEALEAKLRKAEEEKAEAIRKAKEKELRDLRRKEREAKKAAAAPELVKLEAFRAAIDSIEPPHLSDPDLVIIVTQAIAMLESINVDIKNAVKAYKERT
jgi:DNA repair exonuclease SbcCD ATPase subunit